MRNLQIVFTKSKKKMPIASWLIRWWTKKPFSHVARRFELHHEVVGFYQASEGKVNYECENVFSKKHEILKTYNIMVPRRLYREINRACFKEAGKKYALMQNIGIVWVDLCAKLGIEVKNPWKSGLNCSEVLYVAVFQHMIDGLGYNSNTIKPHQIQEIIEKHFIKYEEEGVTCWKLDTQV